MAAPGRRLWGSIPACAGEPRSTPRRRHITQVYPRVCGGALQIASSGRRRTGLSPRVRGSLMGVWTISGILRSIPACAGEPEASTWHLSAGEVYPRVCGGANPSAQAKEPSAGLSPRVRGSRPPPDEWRPRRGSIPACAGEPRESRGTTPPGRVYPRVCGGAMKSTLSAWTICGLSPRVRGSLSGVSGNRDCAGSIPACAGEPVMSARVFDVWEVYPRVCGGARKQNSNASDANGLSPRVRGSRPDTSRGTTGPRSIPACAGEPRSWDC